MESRSWENRVSQTEKKNTSLFTRLETHHYIPKKVYKVSIFLFIFLQRKSFYEVDLNELVEAYIERDLREGAGRGRESLSVSTLFSQ